MGGLVFFGPLMAVTAAAILLDDGRPVLFRQARLGRARRPFAILKFRSMRDGRVTRVGRSCAPPASTSCRSSSTSCAAS